LSIRFIALILIALVLIAVMGGTAFAQSDLEQRVLRLENEARDDAESGIVSIPFGAFWALWAQNTG